MLEAIAAKFQVPREVIERQSRLIGHVPLAGGGVEKPEVGYLALLADNLGMLPEALRM